MPARTGAAIAAGLVILISTALADPSGDPSAASSTDGLYSDARGNPTYRISKDGTVDWYTSIGYLRYTANCLQCHGPDGLGSSFAPSLTDALQSLNYSQFIDTVTNGKQNVSASQDLVMPAFGTNPNVMCFIDAIFVYLRARSDGALGRGQPANSAPRPAGYTAREDACLG
ncbi:c-type cytochrome, methanol metabolism-related [Ancylobacter polymorphus]|uniref:Methanol metabolism-related c-type cytochrome n=1 Tax=Ancylobacter polymorphus TaxID=223390 RepID=A0ABU0BE80_9HYPH|nr:c-type cytochrome, methanol metabolism-related [Ancylobacter polymorphus]MDQ0302784.1 methanol metabolism-related c-type cytochrome [Ancylobacter polymorphus]